MYVKRKKRAKSTTYTKKVKESKKMAVSMAEQLNAARLMLSGMKTKAEELGIEIIDINNFIEIIKNV